MPTSRPGRRARPTAGPADLRDLIQADQQRPGRQDREQALGPPHLPAGEALDVPGPRQVGHRLRVRVEEHILVMAAPGTGKTVFPADVILTYPAPGAGQHHQGRPVPNRRHICRSASTSSCAFVCSELAPAATGVYVKGPTRQGTYHQARAMARLGRVG
jgi:hypothetical protein